MSSLSVQQLIALFNAAISHYETLTDNRAKLEEDCAKLRECIKQQVESIRILNDDFTKLRDTFNAHSEEFAERGISLEHEPSSIAPAPQIAEVVPEITTLVPPEQIKQPLVISDLAEIVDTSVICSTAFSPDGQCLAIGNDKTLRVYDIDQDKFQFEYVLQDGDSDTANHIRSISWTNDCQTIICGGEDGNLRVFSLPYGSLKTTIEVGTGEVFHSISANQEFIAVATGDGNMSILKLEDMSVIAQWKRESSAQVITISPDDKFVAIGYSDCSVVLWDVETKQPVLSKECHDNGVYSMKFVPRKTSEDPYRLVTGSLDNSIKIWDVIIDQEKGIDLVPWKTLDGHSSFVLSVAIDPTGEWLISGSKDLTAKVSSLSTGTMIYSLKAHTNSVVTVSFNPKKSMFCTGSGDQSVKIWMITPEETEENAV